MKKCACIASETSGLLGAYEKITIRIQGGLRLLKFLLQFIRQVVGHQFIKKSREYSPFFCVKFIETSSVWLYIKQVVECMSRLGASTCIFVLKPSCAKTRRGDDFLANEKMKISSRSHDATPPRRSRFFDTYTQNSCTRVMIPAADIFPYIEPSLQSSTFGGEKILAFWPEH